MRVSNIMISFVGCFIMALGVNLGYVPVHLFSTGFPGIGVLTLYVFNWNTGLVVFALNIPLFLLAWKRIGRSFVIQTMMVAGVLSVFLDLLYPIRNWVHPPLWLGIVIGGAFLGLGSGIVFRQGLTSGGVGLLARLIQLRFPKLKMGTVHIAFDFFVLILGALVMDIKTAFFTFLASIIMGRTMDFTKSVRSPFKKKSEKLYNQAS
ncbi:YitT family protein [Paenibacillus terreus]|uniref:YitT family protein n=1 Tax=Paenibacillus terreus TaxID=1387834 RepID=A0ABV5B968_9BACL